MRAELLTIGSELLSGAIVNTNAAYLARRLAEAGIACDRQVAVADDRAHVAGALRDAVRRGGLVLITGGLGPTFDDITMDVLAEVLQRPLVYVPAAAVTVKRFYSRAHRKLQRAALRQAYLPRGGSALPNPIGTAPGLWLSLPEAILVALPGVPSEMRAIMERHVVPRLKRLAASSAIETCTLRTVGLVELQIQRLLHGLKFPEPVALGLYPHLRMVDVRLTVTMPQRHAARQLLARCERKVRRVVGAAVYGADEETLEAAVGRRLVRWHKTLAVAESCTGGLLCDRLTAVSGSSRYLRGGLVAYHNDLKRGCLGVSRMTLARCGAVSAPVARAMADGMRTLAGADVGLAVTGIAGPTGGTPQKPVGLVYLALADGRRTRSLRCQFFGDRQSIKLQAVQTALNWLRLSG